MGSYTKIYIQAVYAVKYRKALIAKEWRSELMGVLGNLINETGCKTIIVNGVADHVHCFFSLKSTLTVAEVMRKTKSKSSKWINDQGLCEERFAWQGGYGAFSYSSSAVENVYNYVKNQEQHHQRQAFLKEYKTLLKKYDIPYEDKYIFDLPI